MVSATFYEDHDYRGFSVTLGLGSYDMNDLIARQVPNDSLSSVRVGSGTVVTMFEHAGFKGRSKSLSTDWPQFSVRDSVFAWNDQVSSIIVRAAGTTSSPSTPTQPIPPQLTSPGPLIFASIKHATCSLRSTVQGSVSFGSGFFVTIRGEKWVVTAAHVVHPTWDTSVGTPVCVGTVLLTTGQAWAFSCDFVGMAGRADVALLRPRWAESNMSAEMVHSLEFALGDHAPTRGDACYSSGNPLALDTCSPSAGIVKDTNYTYYNLVESLMVDMELYEGNSGGPIVVVNPDGKVRIAGIVCFGLQSAPTIGWGAGAAVINHVVNEMARSPGGDFRGGTLGPSAISRPLTIRDAVAGQEVYGVSVSGAAGADPSYVITDIRIDGVWRRAGAFPGANSLSSLYLNPGKTYEIRRSNGVQTTVTSYETPPEEDSPFSAFSYGNMPAVAGLGIPFAIGKGRCLKKTPE